MKSRLQAQGAGVSQYRGWLHCVVRDTQRTITSSDRVHHKGTMHWHGMVSSRNSWRRNLESGTRPQERLAFERRRHPIRSRLGSETPNSELCVSSADGLDQIVAQD